MGLIFTLLIVYPFLEKRFTGDNAHHNLLQRPRDVPVRTAIGAMAIAFYMVLTLSRDERHHRVQVPHLAERDHLDRPHRHGGAAAVHLLHRLPVVLWVCSAATVPCSSTASRPASSNGCRTAPTSNCTSRSDRSTTTATRSRWSTGRAGAQADEQARLGGAPGEGTLLFADPAAEQEALTEVAHAQRAACDHRAA